MPKPFERDIPYFPGEERTEPQITAETTVFRNPLTASAAHGVADFMVPGATQGQRDAALRNIFAMSENASQRFAVRAYIEDLRASVQDNNKRRLIYDDLLRRLDKRFSIANVFERPEDAYVRKPETGRLRGDEVLLAPSPEFIVLNAVQYAYDPEGAPGQSMAERDPLGTMSMLMSESRTRNFVLSGMANFARDFGRFRAIYESMIAGLNGAVGTDRMRLMKDTTNDAVMGRRLVESIPGFSHVLEEQESRAAGVYRTAHVGIQLLGSPTFPRDLMTTIGDTTYLSLLTFPRIPDAPNIKVSQLGEGGAVMQAGNVILLSESLKKPGDHKRHIRELIEAGYKVEYIPVTRNDRQPANKQKYVPNHIDGHSALVLGRDQRPYWLYAGSYAHQDVTTEHDFDSIERSTGVNRVEVDDGELPNLAFNLVQLRDGTIIVPATGRIEGGRYHNSKLDTALERVVGANKIIRTRPMQEVADMTYAGPRCMTNVVPESVLHYVNQFPSQLIR